MKNAIKPSIVSINLKIPKRLNPQSFFNCGLLHNPAFEKAKPSGEGSYTCSSEITLTSPQGLTAGR